MLPAFPAQPTPFPGSTHYESLWEDTRRAPRRSPALQTEDGTSPNLEFRNAAEWVVEHWGRHPQADWCHTCSMAGGSPLITSSV